MKKLKSTLSLIIVMVIIGVSVVSAFAQDVEKEEEVNVYKLAFNLLEYSSEYRRTFRLKLEQNPGALPMDCDLNSANELIEVCNEVDDYYMEIMDGRVPTVEEINSFYPKLDAAAEKVILFRRELKYLIDHCGFETNNNSYYPQDLWEYFQECLEKAVDVYTKETEGIEVSRVYWDLKFAYNKLCVVNTVSGDVDKSGELSILDVTLVQMNLAQMCSLNSSQLTVLYESAEENITITVATKMQLALAKLDKFDSYDLEVLSADTNRMCLNDNSVFRRYRYYKFSGRI